MKPVSKIISITLTCFIFIHMLPLASAVDTKSSLMGDVNGDGVVMIEDALFVLRAASGIVPYDEGDLYLCDTDGDGILTLKDARQILRYACGIDGFEDELLNAGFPKSYIEPLSKLHDKYPDWVFVPMLTGLDWQASIDGERTPHSQQLIEKIVDSSMQCSCAQCYGKTYEGGGWVSASENAVKYYMDPRNFLTEEYIFQFENIRFDEAQTIEGIESILSWTWMYNADITYYDAFGNLLTYSENGQNIKYSEAILRAARDSNVSAYYLASKIVQEVGSKNSANVTTACGTSYPYNGIYNYYNIGAYTGAADGLRWANGYMKTVRSTVMYSEANIESAQVVTIPASTTIYFAYDLGDFYGVRAEVGGVMYAGFVVKDNISVSTEYGRPWNNPYQSIYYGAQWIYNSFVDTQYTGYLQKFNVNPESDTLYEYEYMANVRAAASESYYTYSAYKANGTLESRKVFSIPVFVNMPYADYSKEDIFRNTVPEMSIVSNTNDTVTVQWTAVDGAEGYEIYKYDETTNEYYYLDKVTSTSYTAYTNTDWAYLSVRGYKQKTDYELEYTLFSNGVQILKAPNAPSGLVTTGYDTNYINLAWGNVGADGYEIYRYDGISQTSTYLTTVTANYYTDSSVFGGVYYHYNVRAFRLGENGEFYSSWSNDLQLTTPGQTPVTGVVKVSDYLNIRQSPDSAATIVAKAYNNQNVIILETVGVWYKVQFVYNGVTYVGYGHSDYIVTDNSTVTPPTPETPALEACPYAEPTATLGQGRNNEITSVKWLQWYLYKLGYLTENDIDGDFGPTTNNAVIRFQTDKGLDVDGLVGSGTRAALKTAYGI